MAETLKNLNDLIWQDHLWLPKGVYFKDLIDKPGFIYPQPKDLIYMPLYGIGLNIIRLLFERFVILICIIRV